MQAVSISIYELDSGRILRSTTCIDSDIPLQLQDANEDWIDGHWSDVDYWVDGTGYAVLKTTNVVTFDKTSVVADNVDYCTLSNLPDPCHITIIGDGFFTEHDITSTTETIKFDTVGEYTIQIDSVPYFIHEEIINAY